MCPLYMFCHHACSLPLSLLLTTITSFLYDDFSFSVSFKSSPLLSSPGISALLACLTGKHSRSQLARCPQIERLPSVPTPLPQIPGQFSCPASQVNLGCSLHPRTPSPEPMPNPPPLAQALLPFPASFLHKPKRIQCSVFVRRWTCN